MNNNAFQTLILSVSNGIYNFYLNNGLLNVPVSSQIGFMRQNLDMAVASAVSVLPSAEAQYSDLLASHLRTELNFGLTKTEIALGKDIPSKNLAIQPFVEVALTKFSDEIQAYQKVNGVEHTITPYNLTEYTQTGDELLNTLKNKFGLQDMSMTQYKNYLIWGAGIVGLIVFLRA